MTDTHDECQQSGLHDERLALPIEQGVLLWCMRMWVIEMKRGMGVEVRIDNMLDALGAKSASPFLKSFMFALSHGCTRLIEVQCVCRKRISTDEQALLDALSLAQAMRPFEALLALRGFVTQAGADAALRSAKGIGMALAQAGRFLPEPEEEVRHYALSVTTSIARPPERDPALMSELPPARHDKSDSAQSRTISGSDQTRLSGASDAPCRRLGAGWLAPKRD